LLNIDGHPRRGDFLPPVRLPRRMFAGSALKFIRPLAIGQAVSRVSKVAAVDHRSGKTGDLVFVSVAMSLCQADSVCIEEEQTVVYRPAGTKTLPINSIARAPLTQGEISEDWVPTTTELFRYSASTFNAHRIHYDRPYASEEEGYPDLLVHGPLIATRLCHFAAKVAGGPLSSFAFRGEAPSFVGQEIRLVGTKKNGECTVRAERADGVVAMSGIAFCHEHAEEINLSTIIAALCIP
jgi:3-methylfumaryl-CoA hydratase